MAIPDGPGGGAGIAGDGGHLYAHRGAAGGDSHGRRGLDDGVSGRQRGRRAADPETARRQGVLTNGVLNNDPILRGSTMADYPQGVDMAAAIAAGFILDRREAVPKLIGRHEDFLFVTGLAGTARDIAALTHDGAHIYTMAGAIGAACMIVLCLALLLPDNLV